jgi:TRAP-type C4-dicarboxylate transport system permease large subunit
VTYNEAMHHIHRSEKRAVTRGGMRIVWRFGRPVILTGGSRFIDYTPTETDMRAADWEVVQP